MLSFLLLSKVFASNFEKYDEPLTECAWNFFDYKEYYDKVDDIDIECRGAAWSSKVGKKSLKLN